MSLKAEIFKKLSVTMKNRDLEILKTLRLLQSGIKNKEIELRPKELKESDVLSVLKKQIKQSKESLGFFEKAERQAEIEKLKKEIILLESFLPPVPSAEELKKLVLQVIDEKKASSMKDMGAVMKEVVSRTGGAAEGRQLSEMVRSELARL